MDDDNEPVANGWDVRPAPGLHWPCDDKTSDEVE